MPTNVQVGWATPKIGPIQDEVPVQRLGTHCPSRHYEVPEEARFEAAPSAACRARSSHRSNVGSPPFAKARRARAQGYPEATRVARDGRGSTHGRRACGHGVTAKQCVTRASAPRGTPSAKAAARLVPSTPARVLASPGRKSDVSDAMWRTDRAAHAADPEGRRSSSRRWATARSCRARRRGCRSRATRTRRTAPWRRGRGAS